MTSARERQLSFVFADSPVGGGRPGTPDVSGGKAWLLQRAKPKTAKDLATGGEADQDLMERVASIRNLATALLNVACNKGAPGVDGRSVWEVVEASPKLLFKLRQALLDGGYRPGDIRRVWIPKPGGGQRGLGIPNVVDRWVQEAVRQVLEPIFEPHFHPSSHGFRPNRGAHTAIAEAKAHIAEGYDWVVDLDLSKFFDRVHHQRLLDRMNQRIADRRVTKLVKQMLKAKVVLPDGVRIPTHEGTPQGGPLSPLLSNIVLDELDWELERRGLRFVRYADDANIFVRSERAGHRVMDSTRRFIERKLRLQVNEDKSAVARPESRHFLGFRFRTSGTGNVEVHLSQKTKQRMDARIRELTPRTWGQPLPELFRRANLYLRGWIGYFRLCTEEAVPLLERFDAHIRRRIRAIIAQQKGKRPRYLFRHLLSRGVTRKAAARAAYRRCGPWKRSNLPGLTRAYPNRWFHARLVSLAQSWHGFHPPRAVPRQGVLFDA